MTSQELRALVSSGRLVADLDGLLSRSQVNALAEERDREQKGLPAETTAGRVPLERG